MKKVSLKSFIAMALFMAIGISAVFAAGAAVGIKSAYFNANKVILDGKELNLGSQQMISVVKDGETNMSNYMPVRGVLEAMGYKVDWDGQRNAVIVTSPGKEPVPAPTPRSDGRIRVGIINNPPQESGYREANVKDFETVFSKDKGYDTKTFYSINPDEQLDAARQFIADKVDYLLISAASSYYGWDAVLRTAKDAGVKVFLFDRMINCDSSLYEAVVVSDMAQEGITAVNWLKAQKLSEYNIIHIQGYIGSDAQIGRSAALDKEFAAGTMKKVVQQTATWDETQAKQIVEAVIASGEKFNVIYAENDGMAKGAVAALDKAGITHGVNGDVIIMGFDCNRWALRELLAGNWNYNVQCSPFHAKYIDDMIKNGVKSKTVFVEDKGFDARTITQADIDKYGLGD